MDSKEENTLLLSLYYPDRMVDFLPTPGGLSAKRTKKPKVLQLFKNNKASHHTKHDDIGSGTEAALPGSIVYNRVDPYAPPTEHMHPKRQEHYHSSNKYYHHHPHPQPRSPRPPAPHHHHHHHHHHHYQHHHRHGYHQEQVQHTEYQGQGSSSSQKSAAREEALNKLCGRTPSPPISPMNIGSLLSPPQTRRNISPLPSPLPSRSTPRSSRSHHTVRRSCSANDLHPKTRTHHPTKPLTPETEGFWMRRTPGEMNMKSPTTDWRCLHPPGKNSIHQNHPQNYYDKEDDDDDIPLARALLSPRNLPSSRSKSTRREAITDDDDTEDEDEIPIAQLRAGHSMSAADKYKEKAREHLKMQHSDHTTSDSDDDDTSLSLAHTMRTMVTLDNRS